MAPTIVTNENELKWRLFKNNQNQFENSQEISEAHLADNDDGTTDGRANLSQGLATIVGGMLAGTSSESAMNNIG